MCVCEPVCLRQRERDGASEGGLDEGVWQIQVSWCFEARSREEGMKREIKQQRDLIQINSSNTHSLTALFLFIYINPWSTVRLLCFTSSFYYACVREMCTHLYSRVEKETLIMDLEAPPPLTPPPPQTCCLLTSVDTHIQKHTHKHKHTQ